MDSVHFRHSKIPPTVHFRNPKGGRAVYYEIVRGGGGEGISFAIFRIRILGDLEDLS